MLTLKDVVIADEQTMGSDKFLTGYQCGKWKKGWKKGRIEAVDGNPIVLRYLGYLDS